MDSRIKELREVLGMTQDAFAQKLDVTRGLVNRWEHGADIPKPRLFQIAETFGVRREWIVNGAGEIFEDGEETLANLERKWLVEKFKSFAQDKRLCVLRAIRNNPMLYFDATEPPRELVEFLKNDT